MLKMLLLFLCMAPVVGIKLYLTDGETSNATHRFVVIKPLSTTGKMQPGVESLLALYDQVPGGAGQCVRPAGSVVFFGPPPRSCRQGFPMQGSAHNGYAQLVVPSTNGNGASVNALVRYPGVDAYPLQPVVDIGPFKKCYPAPAYDPYSGMYCADADASGHFINANYSVVWIRKYNAVPDGYLGVFCAFQVFVLAMLASSAQPGADVPLLQLSADAAIGGALFQSWFVANGGSVVGIAAELGDSLANGVNFIVAASTLTFGALAWSVAWITTGSGSISFGTTSTTTPLVAIRELLELPIMLSLCAMWPGYLGRRYAFILNMALALAIPTVAGRATCHFSFSASHFRLWGAVLMLVTTIIGACLLLPAVSASGGIERGTPSAVLSLTLAAHCSMAGYYITLKRTVLR